MQMDIYIVYSQLNICMQVWLTINSPFFLFFLIVVSNVSLTNISIFFSENDHTQMAL